MLSRRGATGTGEEMLKKLLNRSEEVVNSRLRITAEEHGAHVFPKVRLADLLPIEGSGIADDLYQFALKAHFDFVVTDDELLPLFAVEFDGPEHDALEQQRRDSFKNGLAERFALPLLRVRSAHVFRTYDGWDLLSWITDVWFLQSEIDRLYEAGQLPPDFDFDPESIVFSPGKRRRFPYWLGLDAQLRIQRLHEKGMCYDLVPSLFIGVAEDQAYHGMAAIRTKRDLAVYVKSAMRPQQFPVDLTALLRGVLITDLYQALLEVLDGRRQPIRAPDIDKDIKQFCSQLSMHCWSGFSSHRQ